VIPGQRGQFGARSAIAPSAWAVAVASAVVVVACGAKKPPLAPAPTVSTQCPDLTKADEVAAFDFEKEYVLSRDAADKLKAAALAAWEIGQLAEKIDVELGIACASISRDLGAKGDWRSGNDACAAAVKTVHDARAKLGPQANAQMVVREPLCLADVSLMTKCASICDSSVPAEKVKGDCEKTAGRCDGNCDGSCEPKVPTKCDGQCIGTCDGPVKGQCGGRCKGTCDGHKSTGSCAGLCIGTCDHGALSGECKGACAGTCKPKAPGICEGQCAGKCSVELTDAKCAGDFKTPEVSTDCRSRCELAVINQTDCSDPTVGLIITGAKDREVAETMKASIDRSFPGLLKILYEVGLDKGAKRVLNAKAIIEGARTGFAEMAASGGKRSAAASQAQLEKCFNEPFKKAAADADAVKTGLDEATGVRDEVTK
jgi:hypothetical protein